MAENAYKDSGVDIQAGNALVEAIKPAIKSTMRSGTMGNIGGFGAMFDLKATEKFNDPILVSATDGVGTKLKIAFEMNMHDTIGIDLVAMCVNDLIVQGAEPLFFLDYFATGKLEVGVAEKVVLGITEGCKQAGCALIGGETAEMPGMYAKDHYDLAGFCVGAVDRPKVITGENIEEGDVILSLASNGLHSNGFSLVRKIVDEQSDLGQKPPFESQASTIGEALLAPTKIYIKPLLKAFEKFDIKGLAHITGGGLLENIPRILPKGLSAHLDTKNWPLPPVMHWLKGATNLTDNDLALTFNCGIGMAIICAANDKKALKQNLEDSGETVYEIGHIQKNNESISIANMETAWATK